MIRVKTSSFSSLKPLDLVAAAQENVIAVNNGGTLFTGIAPTAEIVNAAVEDAVEKTLIARKGSTIQKNERDSAITILRSYLFQWAGFISSKCTTLATEQDMIEFIEAAAFVPTAKGGHVGPLGPVTKIRTKSMPHQICIEWETKKGAHSYKVMKTEGYATEDSVWTEMVTTTRAKVVCDAEVGKVMSFVIYAIGTAGIGVVSADVSSMATL